MSLPPPKRPPPASLTKPLEDFTWPPSDGVLDLYQPEPAVATVGATAAEPPVTSAVPPDMQAPVDAPPTPHETGPLSSDPKKPNPNRESVVFKASVRDLASPGSSDSPPPAASDDARDETRPKPSDVEDAQWSGTANPMTAAIAVGEREVKQEAFANDIAAEIAHLQALIDGLTQKVDKQITIVNDGEARQKHSQFL